MAFQKHANVYPGSSKNRQNINDITSKNQRIIEIVLITFLKEPCIISENKKG
jgi:hypothetical protein